MPFKTPVDKLPLAVRKNGEIARAHHRDDQAPNRSQCAMNGSPKDQISKPGYQKHWAKHGQ